MEGGGGRPWSDDEEEALRRLHAHARTERLARHLAFVGFMGAGKSSVGQAVAHRLGRPFFDSDAVVEERSGRRIPDFFAAGEEAAFRAIEAETIRALLERDAIVLSLGGGALQDPATRALLFERCFVIHLFVPWPRLRASLPALVAGRPLLAGRTEAEVHELYLRRQQTYRDAHLRIDAPRGDVDAAADEVLLRLFPDGDVGAAASGRSPAAG